MQKVLLALAILPATIKGFWKDRIYSPLVTLWVFLGQVLSADHFCRAAVARLTPALESCLRSKPHYHPKTNLFQRRHLPALGTPALAGVDGESAAARHIAFINRARRAQAI